jgi:hypothetical protein
MISRTKKVLRIEKRSIKTRRSSKRKIRRKKRRILIISNNKMIKFKC